MKAVVLRAMETSLCFNSPSDLDPPKSPFLRGTKTFFFFCLLFNRSFSKEGVGGSPTMPIHLKGDFPEWRAIRKSGKGLQVSVSNEFLCTIRSYLIGAFCYAKILDTLSENILVNHRRCLRQTAKIANLGKGERSNKSANSQRVCPALV